MESKVQILAHRGGAITAPENTREAFERAAQEGAHGVECDVRLTRDGEPVLFHDRETRRLLGIPGRVEDFLWRDLQAQRVLGKGPVLHLRDFIDFLLRHPRMEAYFDLQEGSERGTLERIAACVREARLAERIYILGFSRQRRWLLEAKKMDPGLRTAVMPILPYDFVGCARSVGAERLCAGWNQQWIAKPWFLFCSWVHSLKREVSRAKEQGLWVTGGLANTEEELRWFLSLGFQGIWTDDLLLVRRFTKEG